MNAAAQLQELLRRLFRLDEPHDLDFGIHRVIGQKRDHLREYIKTELPKQVRGILEKSRNEAAETKLAELTRARQWVVESLGASAIDADGNLTEPAFAKTPSGKDLVRVQQEVLRLKSAEEMREEMHDHLANFFARYECGGGDIVPQRRHSVHNRYALPHNGEEVLMHWANRDQYYIKSAAYHPAIAFKVDGKRFKFQIADARDIPRDNNKDTGRFLIPEIKKAATDQNGDIVIPFAFRALDKDEKKRLTDIAVAEGENGNGSAIQGGILTEALDELEKAAAKNPALRPLQKTHTSEPQDTDKPQKSVFAVHAARFVRRNTADFFIHRNLRKFLGEELDLYLKCEVLNADELIGLNGLAVSARMVVFRAVREIAANIADKLAEWEDLQKALWEKKKFVLSTEYCIAVGCIPNADKSGILDAIAECDMQWAEWEKLGINCGKKRKDYLRENPSLPIDTAHFPPEFKDLLLMQFADIDDATDGVLIHGENWQALNLIQEMYRGRVQCVYIDPPYNTDESKIIYKNDFEHSSWLCLLANRYDLTKFLVAPDAVIMTAIDDFEMSRLCLLSDQCFPMCARHVVIVNHHPQGAGMGGAMISRTHEYMVVLSFPDAPSLKGGRIDENVERRAFRRAGRGGNNFRGEFSNSFYAVLVDPETYKVVGLEPPLVGNCLKEETSEGLRRIYPLGKDGSERVWRFAYESGTREFRAGNLECTNKGVVKMVIHHGDERRGALFTNWTNACYNAGVHGENLLADIMGESGAFSYPKSIYTVMDAVEAATHSRKNAIILDYFAGSGTTAHAVVNLNREDGGQRKFILAEAGEHFDTVILPRVKKIIYAPEWLDGKPSRQATAKEFERGPRLVKYQRIESYEDTLANIEFAGPDEEKQGELELAERLVKIAPRYELEWESRGCATRLSELGLDSPFSYGLELLGDGEKTRTESADLPETFAYLAGLRVRTRRIEMDGERRYLVQRGLCGGRETAVIWRETADWKKPADYDRDAEFIKNSEIAKGADWILVNGDSSLPQAESLNPIFGDAMFSAEEGE